LGIDSSNEYIFNHIQEISEYIITWARSK